MLWARNWHEVLTIYVQTGEQLKNVQAHEFDHQINDIQFSGDRTYFLTASKDKAAKVGISPDKVNYVSF